MNNLNIIREISKRKNITLKDLSNRVGISEQGLQKIIKEGTGRSSTLNKIAKELDISIEVLFEGREEISFKSLMNDSYTTEELKEILNEKISEIIILKNKLNNMIEIETKSTFIESDELQNIKNELKDIKKKLDECLEFMPKRKAS